MTDRLTAAESLKLALDYIAQHPTRHLFPLAPGTKHQPCIKDNLKRASNSVRQIEAWAKRFPGCNWGLSPAPSNLCPMDIDTKSGKSGAATLAALELVYGDLPMTEEVQTPSGGKHLYFIGEHVFALGKGGFGEDIDCPQYTLIPGCRTDQGEYTLVSFVDAEPAPAWFYNKEILGKAKENKGPKIADVTDSAVDNLDAQVDIDWVIHMLQNDAEPAIAFKNGNNQTWKIAAQCRGRALSQAKTFELMFEYYNPRCEPEWSVEELERIIANAYAHARQERVGEKSARAEFSDDPVEDFKPMGNPKRIAREAAERKQIANRTPSTPLNQKRRIPTLADVLDEFVYVAGVDLFVNVNKPKQMWKRISFDSYFKDINPRLPKLSDALLKERNPKAAIRKFESLGYVPGEGISVEGGRVCNLYRAPDVTPMPGDTTFWTEHLEFLFPDEEERNHLLNWLAWFYQNPKRKPKHALLIQGYVQGTGKSFIVDMLSKIIGEHNVTQVSQSDLAGSFNGYAMRTKLISIEELRALDKGSVKMALHDIITQDMISINEKNMPKFEMRNCFGIIAMTNDDAAISLDMSDRRYLVVRTPAEPRDTEYYSKLYAKLDDPEAVAAVAFALQTRDIGQYDGAGRAPSTKAKAAMIDAGLSELDTYLLENANQYPLNGRVITVSDVAAILPARFGRLNSLNRSIANALRNHFKGEMVGQTPLSDRSRPRLWAINGCAVAKFEDGLVRAGKIYELDRQKAGDGKPIDPTDDFAGDDPEKDLTPESE
jgi:hypothetical protein